MESAGGSSQTVTSRLGRRCHSTNITIPEVNNETSSKPRNRRARMNGTTKQSSLSTA
jgi:hypothetical protein